MGNGKIFFHTKYNFLEYFSVMARGCRLVGKGFGHAQLFKRPAPFALFAPTPGTYHHPLSGCILTMYFFFLMQPIGTNTIFPFVLDLNRKGLESSISCPAVLYPVAHATAFFSLCMPREPDEYIPKIQLDRCDTCPLVCLISALSFSMRPS